MVEVMENHQDEAYESGMADSPKYDPAAEPTAIARLHAEQPAEVHARDEKINQALDMVKLGHTMSGISKQLKVNRSRLIGYLLREQPERYRAAQHYIASICASEQLDDIEHARDQLELGKAREKSRVILWLLERRYPALYGQKSHLTVEAQVGDLGDRLLRAQQRRERVIDVTPTYPTASLPAAVIVSDKEA